MITLIAGRNKWQRNQQFICQKWTIAGKRQCRSLCDNPWSEVTPADTWKIWEDISSVFLCYTGKWYCMIITRVISVPIMHITRFWFFVCIINTATYVAWLWSILFTEHWILININILIIVLITIDFLIMFCLIKNMCWMETSTKWRVQVPWDSYLTGFTVFLS